MALLEREAELRALADLLDGLADGGGRVVLIGGEAGVGKTSLVGEIRRRAGDGRTFVVSACEPLSVPVPLAPLRELAEAAGAGDPVGPHGDRLDAARRLAAALGRLAPVVAVVEDVHWADPSTLDVVRLLIRRIEASPVALVLTYRDDEVGANPALEQLLGDLASSASVRRLRLRPLSQAAVETLAAPAGRDAGRLLRVTGGNPFLVVEALAAPDELPATVREATLARAGRLSRPARAVVDAAAVIGQRVSPALLEAVAPGSSAAVDDALARGVLVADGETLGFRHELLRTAVESAIPPTRRAELHARVVRALEGRGAREHARLAHHAELAGMGALACCYAAQAASEAERLGALDEAAQQAARALRLGRELDDAERFELLLQHSRAANFASARLEDSIESAEAAEALAVSLADPLRQGRALLVLGPALWSADRVQEARAAADRAVGVLDGTADLAQRARAHALRIRFEATTLDPPRALLLAPAALGLADRGALADTRIDVEISVALARGHLGQPEALGLLESAIARSQAAGLPIQAVRASVNLVFMASMLRRHEDVERAATAAMAVFETHQTQIPGNAVQSYRARSLLDRGRWTEAAAIASLQGRNWAAEAPVVRSIVGIVAARAGDAAGDRMLAPAWEELRPLPDTSRHGMVRAALVEAAWLRGDRPAALAHLEAARAAGTARRFARPAADLAAWAARLGVEADVPDAAPEPVLAELRGDWRAAVRGWGELDAPYEAALAALRGDERAARRALAALAALGAPAAARALSRDRAAAGGRELRGPRRSTAAHPAGLTRREQEVLERLAAGARNRDIAAALHLSERTVAHHVSAILRKLDAPTRLRAIERARSIGLLAAQDRQPTGPT